MLSALLKGGRGCVSTLDGHWDEQADLGPHGGKRVLSEETRGDRGH